MSYENETSIKDLLEMAHFFATFSVEAPKPPFLFVQRGFGSFNTGKRLVSKKARAEKPSEYPL